MSKRCKCEMPFWAIEDMEHCAQCGGLLPDIAMKRPEKKEALEDSLGRISPAENFGYSQAHDEWEEYLPTYKEITLMVTRIIIGSTHSEGLTAEQENMLADQIAIEFAKRIGKYL